MFPFCNLRQVFRKETGGTTWWILMSKRYQRKRENILKTAFLWKKNRVIFFMAAISQNLKRKMGSKRKSDRNGGRKVDHGEAWRIKHGWKASSNLVTRGRYVSATWIKTERIGNLHNLKWIHHASAFQSGTMDADWGHGLLDIIIPNARSACKVCQ